jgi:hypothetical protein
MCLPLASQQVLLCLQLLFLPSLRPATFRTLRLQLLYAALEFVDTPCALLLLSLDALLKFLGTINVQLLLMLLALTSCNGWFVPLYFSRGRRCAPNADRRWGCRCGDAWRYVAGRRRYLRGMPRSKRGALWRGDRRGSRDHRCRSRNCRRRCRARRRPSCWRCDAGLLLILSGGANRQRHCNRENQCADGDVLTTSTHVMISYA